MNQNFTSTSLQSEYDVIRFQATRAVMDEAAKRGFKDDKEGAWSTYKQYGDPSKDGYLATQRAREGGLTPEIFTETMKILKTQVAGGSYSNMTEAVVKAFGINYRAAKDVIESFDKGSYLGAISKIEAPANATSPEMKLETTLQEIQRNLANAGSAVLPGKTEIMAVLNGILAGIVGDKVTARYQASVGDTLGLIYGNQAIGSDDLIVKTQAARLLSDAMKNPTKYSLGQDKNGNSINDNADAAMQIQDYLSALPETMRRYIDASGILNGAWKGKTVNDLPGIADFITSGKYMTPDAKKEYEKYTGLSSPHHSDIDSFFGRVREWNPQWGKQFGALSQFQGAVGNQVGGSVDLFREFSFRLSKIDEAWSTRKSKDIEAAKDPKSPGGIKITSEEQKTIDSYNDTGKKRQVDSFLSSSLGTFNELIQDAMEKGTPGRDGGKEITSDEWADMLPKLLKGLSDFSMQFKDGATAIAKAGVDFNQSTEIVVGGGFVPYSTAAAKGG
jgi:hypothetical protein